MSLLKISTKILTFLLLVLYGSMVTFVRISKLLSATFWITTEAKGDALGDALENAKFRKTSVVDFIFVFILFTRFCFL